MPNALKAEDAEIARAQAAGGATPANTGTPGKRSRSEVARLAALARWGKYKGGKKPAPKKGKKPAQTPEAKEAARRQEAQANRAKVGDELNAQDAPLSKSGLASIEALASGAEAPNADGLVSMGLAVKGEDGRYRLTAQGKKAYNAAGKGDVAGVLDAVSEANDKRPKPKEEKPAEEEKPKAGGGGGGSAGKPSDEEKEAERQAKADKKKAEQRQGVKDKMRDSDTGLSPSGFDAFTGFADGGDLEPRAASQLADMGLVEGDPPRLSVDGRSARNAIDRGDFRGAVDAIERGKARKAEAADRERVKTERATAQQKRQTAREQARDLLEQRRRADAQARENARPMRARAVKTEDAMDYADILNSLLDTAEALEPDATKAGKRHNASDQALVQAIYDAACGVCEMAVSLGAQEPAEDDDEETVDEAMGMSVKMLPGGGVGGYAVRFGSADEPDLSAFRDFFTKSTDFWLDAWDTRPMLYHHAQDEATKDAPVVGRWTQARVDDVGVWLEGQLDTAHRYAGAVKELIRRGVLRLSSDSAPHLVVREAQPNSTNWVKRWPLMACSLTPSPAEPRLLPVGALKAAYLEAGLLPPAELDETDEGNPLAAIDADPEATATDPVEAQADPLAETTADDRARRLLIDIDLYALEA
jgi:phage head maturation protease